MNMVTRLAGALALALFVAGCGGGSSVAISSGGGDNAPATVGIALTDAPSGAWDQVLATITSITLIGEPGQVTVFSGSETVDLLKLADYSELFTVADNVPPGTYSKIRLQLSALRLVRLDSAGNVIESIDTKLVANGKLDLNPQGPFAIGPGANVVISLDFDVAKSLKITTTGNGQVIVRPVVFVDIHVGAPLAKLARIHGVIQSIGTDGSYVVCQTALVARQVQGGALPDPDRVRCVTVVTDEATGVFGLDGLPATLADLAVGDEATFIGRLRPITPPEPAPVDQGQAGGPAPGDCFQLLAAIIEEGPLGTYRRYQGVAQGSVDGLTDQFNLALAPGQGVVSDVPLAVQLYPASRIFARSGAELARTDIQPGVSLVTDSVLALAQAGNVLRTPLVIIGDPAAPGEVNLHGSILTLDLNAGSLTMATPTGDRCVDGTTADVFLISDTGDSFTSTRGSLEDLVSGQVITVFGYETAGGCVAAGTILADAGTT